MDGHIWVEDAPGPDGGATFAFSLPLGGQA
jgi:signal transduction histidine kinase